MGYVVLHLNKVSGNSDAAMTAHIERTIDPKNADPTRTHLNRELVEFPTGVENRTVAIQYRLDTAGLTRKIGTNQVRAIRVMLSGSPEDMKWIEASGKLPDWYADNLAWLRKTYGVDNVVSAVLHMDEKTPHIHATVVPIVTGERRKAAQAKTATPAQGKKTYRKKSVSAPRLCADDMMARNKLTDYQNSYAEAMSKYGLSRGIVGSDARHITTLQYYRDLEANKQDLEEHVEALQEQKEEVNEKIRDLYDRKDDARIKFLVMDEHLKEKKKELSEAETKLRQANRDLEPVRMQEDFNLLKELFPFLLNLLKLAKYCLSLGFSKDQTKELVTLKPVRFNGNLYSSEHKQHFDAENVTARIERSPADSQQALLTIDGTGIGRWFSERYQKLQQKKQVQTPIQQPQLSQTQPQRPVISPPSQSPKSPQQKPTIQTPQQGRGIKM